MYTLSEEDVGLLAGLIRMIRGTRIPGGAVTPDGMVFPTAARSAGMSVSGGWAGQIVDAGPEEEADFTDERYWVERARCTNHDEDPADAAAAFEALEEEHELANIVAVTNLPEILDGGHALAVGTDVWVWEVWDRSDPPRARRVMMAVPAGMVVFKVHSHAAGGGKYQLTILTGAATSVLAGNVNMPEGMTANADNSALGINMAEHGSSGHAVAVDAYGLGTIVGRMADGRPIVMFSPGGGAIAVYNDTVLLKAAPTHIKIPASCSQVLEFVEDPADTAGVLLRLKANPTNFGGIYYESGVWKLGAMRLT